MNDRIRLTPGEVYNKVIVPSDKYNPDRIKNLRSNLALPSYVHAYSLGIEYMYNWFKSRFDKDFFRGGIYIDGKNVLDDYKRLNEFSMRNIVKGQNPRARMSARVDYEFDREGVDLYQAPPEVYLRRSNYQTAFFKDFDRELFLAFAPRGLRMNFDFKVRLNSRAQQLDTFNRMELNFRNGATQSEFISVDFHVPKYIIYDIARKAGFEIKDDMVVDIIEFVQYLNRHSEIPFLFKLRAINQKPEFFIRVHDVYAHIATRDKLNLDDGERDGKLDFNFHIEMASILTIPMPHYYAYYSAEEINGEIITKETNDCVALYSINTYDIPLVNEKGWDQLCITDYQSEEGDEYIDISSLFNPNTPMSKAIDHVLSLDVSPSKFLDIKVIRDDDISKFSIHFDMDWKNKRIKLRKPNPEEILHIAIYCDKVYMNELSSELGKYNTNRISK